MAWEWEVLLGVVRLLFLLAPFTNVENRFSIEPNKLTETKEFAQASSCRAMLVSFPVELFFAILAQASNMQCRTMNLLMVAVYAVISAGMGFGLYKISAHRFRGIYPPFLWFAGFTAVSILAKIFGLEPAAALICQH